MYPYISARSIAKRPTPANHRRRPPRDGFALILTLLILCLLIIVVVSYLASMSVELQTADAFASRSRAADAAQAAVDSATAMLTESIRDFPDSATVWDTQQSTNFGSPASSSIVGGTNNEGTSLYLRAVPTNGSPVTADPRYVPPSTASNSSNGNNPNNPACKTFVLPLVSGVPNGKAQLVGNKASILPLMDLTQADPTKQNWADLNVRRFGVSLPNYPNGDNQGAIGSPPGWNGVGPKPARALWVNLKGNNNLITGRYAFWVEDESFRANNSLLGSATAQPDNTARPLDTNGKPRVQLPGDLTLVGPLTVAKNANPLIADPTSTTGNIVAARKQAYPSNFFPDPLAFSHALDSTTLSGIQTIDALRYLTTNQSSALNLSRHGSQRLNLNATIPSTLTIPAASVIQTQINQLVQTIEYHLPYFGERFYRLNGSGLNDATQVPGSPYAAPGASPPYATLANGTPITDGSLSQIYNYKIAANIRDYVDTDSQPTIIGSSPAGVVMTGAPTAPLTESGTNDFWAQGKECTPYIQEVAVRYRPVVTPNSNYQKYYNYSINVDYYIEFWNMSDRDISASQMNNPTIWVRDQQTWDSYYPRDSILPDPGSEDLIKNTTPADMQIGLVTGVTDRYGAAVQNGVVFRAGTVTVITTDPQCATYTYKELLSSGASGASGGKTNHPSLTIPTNVNLFVCPVIAGNKVYTGKIVPYNSAGTLASTVGIQMGEPFEGNPPYTSTTPFPGTEISLINNYGYFDVVRGAITKTGACGYHIYTKANNTDPSQGAYNDYSYGSSIMGNVRDTGGGPLPGNEVATVSQLGDPRTNNEQIKVNNINFTADGTRFVASTRTLGSPNYPDLAPDSTASGEGWPDFYKFPPATPTNSQNPDATTAPVVIAGATTTDGPLTSIGQLGDVFDPARAPGSDINYSHGGGRTFKIGQHDDLYSDDPTTNVYSSANGATNTIDNVPASNGWASWRLTDIFDVDNPIQLPGRINMNGAMRDNGAAILSALQGFAFQPTTASGTADPVVHGDPSTTLPGTAFDTTIDSAGARPGFTQLLAQMKQRLTGSQVKPFFERGELGELGYSSSGGGTPLFGTNSTSTDGALVTGVDMNKTTDHSREEMFRRLAQMICTRGNTFTVYAVGQSIIQTVAGGPLKVTGTQRMRVTFRLVPKAKDASGSFSDFHPAYTTNPDGTIARINTIDTANPTEQLTSAGQIGVIPRFAKPDLYDAQILEAIPY